VSARRGAQPAGDRAPARRPDGLYLDKPVEDLSWAEIAFLTAIPQAPARANPFLPTGRARAVARGQAILDRLRASGVLSAEEHDLARQQIARLRVPPAGERPREALHAVLRLERMLRAEAAQGKAPPPIVRTWIDLDVPGVAADAVLRAQRKWEAQGAGNAALLVLAHGTNEVRAWVGSCRSRPRAAPASSAFAPSRGCE
jgi:penicillin-binding protein 1C